jgi:hypothetical protein
MTGNQQARSCPVGGVQDHGNTARQDAHEGQVGPAAHTPEKDFLRTSSSIRQAAAVRPDHQSTAKVPRSRSKRPPPTHPEQHCHPSQAYVEVVAYHVPIARGGLAGNHCAEIVGGRHGHRRHQG